MSLSQLRDLIETVNWQRVAVCLLVNSVFITYCKNLKKLKLDGHPYKPNVLLMQSFKFRPFVDPIIRVQKQMALFANQSTTKLALF